MWVSFLVLRFWPSIFGHCFFFLGYEIHFSVSRSVSSLQIGWPTSLPTNEKESFIKSVLREKVLLLTIYAWDIWQLLLRRLIVGSLRQLIQREVHNHYFSCRYLLVFRSFEFCKIYLYILKFSLLLTREGFNHSVNLVSLLWHVFGNNLNCIEMLLVTKLAMRIFHPFNFRHPCISWQKLLIRWNDKEKLDN